MKFIIITLTFLAVWQTIHAQSTDYKLILNEQGIQVFAKEVECHDNQNGIHQLFYALQWINTTDEVAIVSFNIDYWMNGACVTCNKPKTAENTYTLHLMPGETIEGTCDKNSPKGTKIYLRQLYNTKSPSLSKFEIVNLTVNKL